MNENPRDAVAGIIGILTKLADIFVNKCLHKLFYLRRWLAIDLFSLLKEIFGWVN